MIEERWQTRFGSGEIAELRAGLLALIRQFDVELPDYLPVVAHDMFATVPELKGEVANFLRVMDDGTVRVRDLPRLTGVSKEAAGIAGGVSSDVATQRST